MLELLTILKQLKYLQERINYIIKILQKTEY